MFSPSTGNISQPSFSHIFPRRLRCWDSIRQIRHKGRRKTLPLHKPMCWSNQMQIESLALSENESGVQETLDGPEEMPGFWKLSIVTDMRQVPELQRKVTRQAADWWEGLNDRSVVTCIYPRRGWLQRTQTMGKRRPPCPGGCKEKLADLAGKEATGSF